jgi:hypothetical protein
MLGKVLDYLTGLKSDGKIPKNTANRLQNLYQIKDYKESSG